MKLTTKDLSLEYGLSQRAITQKAKASLSANSALVLADKKYRVIKDGKSYSFLPIQKEVKKEITFSDSDKKWLKASEEKKKEAISKARVVALWESRNRSVSFEKFIQTLPREYDSLKLSEASFFRWVKLVRDAKQKGIPPSFVLLDSRGGSRGTSKLTKDQENFLIAQYLKNPTIKYIKLFNYLKNNFEDVPSYSTIERFIKRYISEHNFAIKYANDPTKAEGELRPSFGKKDANITYANQLWELDATPADIITADGKRLIISAGIDVYSRRAVVVLEESASFTTLGKLFRKAIKTLGIPDAVKTDNGKDYTSNNFEYMCQRLQIEHILTPPYSGWEKPFIERFFRRLSQDLFEELNGYIGHNVAQREAIQNRQTYQKKLEAQAKWRAKGKKGDDFAKKFASKKENLGMNINLPMTRAELELWIDKWLKVYENSLHRGLNTSPIDRFNSSMMPIKRVSDQRVLDILVGFSELKKVTKKGITWNNIVYTAPELWEFISEKVYVLMDDDLGKLYVYDTNYNYITTATEPNFSGKSRAEFIKATKKHDKRKRKLIKLLEELRSEDTNFMLQHIDIELNKIEPNKIKEIGYEYKNDITKGVIEALEDNKQEVHQELKDDSVVPTIDTKPVFSSPYDRFVYELKNNCVSPKTQTLAKKYPDSWEAAKKAAS